VADRRNLRAGQRPVKGTAAERAGEKGNKKKRAIGNYLLYTRITPERQVRRHNQVRKGGLDGREEKKGGQVKKLLDFINRLREGKLW